MTRILKTSLAIALLTGCALWAQSSAPPPLQPGIRVNMAVSEHGQPVPEADDAKAWVATITHDGKLFFHANQTTPEELLEFLKSQPRNRNARFYIKADSLVPFANVQKMLDEARELRFDTAILLTSQPVPASAGGIVPPVGLAIQVGATETPNSVSVQIIKTTHSNPLMRINNQQIRTSAFGNALRIVLQTKQDKTVLVRADGELPFSQVAEFMDTCRAAGATLAMTGTVK